MKIQIFVILILSLYTIQAAEECFNLDGTISYCQGNTQCCGEQYCCETGISCVNGQCVLPDPQDTPLSAGIIVLIVLIIIIIVVLLATILILKKKQKQKMMQVQNINLKLPEASSDDQYDVELQQHQQTNGGNKVQHHLQQQLQIVGASGNQDDNDEQFNNNDQEEDLDKYDENGLKMSKIRSSISPTRPSITSLNPSSIQDLISVEHSHNVLTKKNLNSRQELDIHQNQLQKEDNSMQLHQPSYRQDLQNSARPIYSSNNSDEKTHNSDENQQQQNNLFESNNYQEKVDNQQQQQLDVQKDDDFQVRKTSKVGLVKRTKLKAKAPSAVKLQEDSIKSAYMQEPKKVVKTRTRKSMKNKSKHTLQVDSQQQQKMGNSLTIPHSNNRLQSQISSQNDSDDDIEGMGTINTGRFPQEQEIEQ